MAHSHLTRYLAVLLPLCLMWVFVACVSLCSPLCADTDELSQAVEQIEVEAPHQSGCPITEAPRSVLPERQSFGTQVVGELPALLSPPAPSTNYKILHSSFLLALGSSDPPFERLHTLRI
jgi:hypothetical protein